jgi:dTMP kinase
MLITFEGIDGCGKTTQLKLLKDRLKSEGIPVSDFREPGGTELSEVIRGILLNPEIEMHPVTELLLFSAARSQLIAEKVIPELEKGYVVLLDRFYDSTIAYQGYGRQSLDIQGINSINKIASHRLEPDLTIYMKISLEEAEKRRSHLQKDRMESFGDSFYNQVINGFDELADQETRIITMDATLERDKVHRMIWNIVEEKLGKTR